MSRKIELKMVEVEKRENVMLHRLEMEEGVKLTVVLIKGMEVAKVETVLKTLQGEMPGKRVIGLVLNKDVEVTVYEE